MRRSQRIQLIAQLTSLAVGLLSGLVLVLPPAQMPLMNLFLQGWPYLLANRQVQIGVALFVLACLINVFALPSYRAALRRERLEAASPHQPTSPSAS